MTLSLRDVYIMTTITLRYYNIVFCWRRDRSTFRISNGVTKKYDINNDHNVIAYFRPIYYIITSKIVPFILFVYSSYYLYRVIHQTCSSPSFRLITNWFKFSFLEFWNTLEDYNIFERMRFFAPLKNDPVTMHTLVLNENSPFLF